jgi:hypothetical protein
MGLLNNINSKEVINDDRSLITPFNKDEIIREILETREEKCPGWHLFKVLKSAPTIGKIIISGIDEHGHPKQIPDLPMRFMEISGDFLAIYTDVIDRQIRITDNPFQEYKTVVQSIYQIVREICITDEDLEDNENNLYKRITANSAKQLFIKLKREQEA